jgi:hypothetical protein
MVPEELPTFVDAKLSGEGVIVTMGASAIPVPLSAEVCVPGEALSVTWSVAL